MKTSELTGAALDWAVGIANGWVTYPTDSVERGQYFHTNRLIAPRGHEHNLIRVESFQPSTDWAQGGPIIEREEIDVLMEQQDLKTWAAEIYHSPKAYIRQRGRTPLIAAMRCFVASKLGNDVEVPKELENV
jgi:hypothetical protein